MRVLWQSWPEEKIAALTDMWAKGFAAAHIGRELGHSRNSVLGKVHRLRLPKRASTQSDRRPRQPKPFRVENRRPRAVKAPTKPKAVPLPPRPVVEPLSRCIPFSERANWQCSWIAGEPGCDATCCGHRVKPGSSFCPHHHQRAWQKPERRVR